MQEHVTTKPDTTRGKGVPAGLAVEPYGAACVAVARTLDGKTPAISLSIRARETDVEVVLSEDETFELWTNLVKAWHSIAA